MQQKIHGKVERKGETVLQRLSRRARLEASQEIGARDEDGDGVIEQHHGGDREEADQRATAPMMRMPSEVVKGSGPGW